MPDAAYFIPREDTPPMPPLIDRGDEMRFEIEFPPPCDICRKPTYLNGVCAICRDAAAKDAR